MTKKEEAKRNIKQISDFSPPIVNCRGPSPCGRLTSREVGDIKSLPIATDLRKQQAVSKQYDCPRQGNTEIAYFPKEMLPILGRNPIIAIQALCLNRTCKYNLGLPAKK
ncbi:MAG: hypothetical protein GX559_02075 [Candidatus Pacebacteria bacterium]|mgnify:CR=1 FL=1|nr:hypothetical protein [Candidatus Paceibacterota bacterium]